MPIHRPYTRLHAALPVLGLALGLGVAVPGWAQTTTAQPAATTETQTITTQGPRGPTTRQEEVIITPRSYPSFEENDAFHRAEYERLSLMFQKPNTLNVRAETLMDVPNGKMPQDRSALRAIINDPDTPHLQQVLDPDTR
ncbi:MAG: hypothetical protein PW843_20150 [Azospirillaceae bacterium]|nr:hypothetical protein [Azospirillaceae bacterium]